MVTHLIDFETKSRLNLEYTNAVKYARHPSTQAICMSVNGVKLWRPGMGYPFAHRSGISFESFNAGFELAIWNECCVRLYGWPILDPNLITCLAAEAYYAGLPRNMADISDALAFGKKGKDAEGHSVMLRLTKPVGAKCTDDGEWIGGEFDTAPEKVTRCGDYCLQDGKAELLLKNYVRPLPPFERKLWLVHNKINQRGIPVDVKLCRNAMWMVRKERERLLIELKKTTKGAVTKLKQTAALKDWLATKGVFVSNVQKATLGALNKKELPPDVAKTLTIRELIAGAAVDKFQAIICHAEADSRCRGVQIYYKAGTGRFQSAGVNFGNLKRLNEDEVPMLIQEAERVASCRKEDLVTMLVKYQQSKLGVIPALGKLVRLAICAPPKKKLIVRDYSSIEMNKLHWLAGDEVVLNQIRAFYASGDKNKEPYRLAAAMMYKVPVAEVTKPQRQAGKVYYLGCGYVSGPAKLRGFALNYGIEMSEDEANEMVQLYRRSNPLVVNLWHSYLRMAIRAVENPGRHYEAGRVDFYVKGSTLRFRLPSGRELCYYAPKVVRGAFGKEIECTAVQDGPVAKGGRRWLSITTIVENIDQASSRDLLADALIKCEAENIPVVHHVYDEIVAEVDEDDDKTMNLLKQIMTDPPAWAAGMPIKVEGGESRRYTK